ncbi:hypothetical protein QBC35DRAFT_439057 [Podospora australis]|uniref:Uncharacterized protein n=1 Tax=Podospora australis TaxID=1536484 RepID=A0AAN7AGA6_9PEZI|nr:hypothetical protein QBC35DRAFT_439057 [Podospora australis]
MDAIHSMLGCLSLRRRRSREGYTELIFDESSEKQQLEQYYHDRDNEKDGSYYNDNDHYDDCPSSPPPPQYQPVDSMVYSSSHEESEDEIIANIARDVVRLLFEAEWNDDVLQGKIVACVGENRRWNRRLVEECLDNIIEYVEQGRQHMGEAMVEALDKVTDIADECFAFPRRHPASVDGFIAIVSVGVLAEMQGAWVLELLGFGEVASRMESSDGEVKMLTSDKIVVGLKPRRGSMADWWTRSYETYIPRGGVCSFLKRLDMLDTETEEVEDDDYNAETE